LAYTLIFGIQHSNVLEVGTKIPGKGLLGEGKIEHFSLDLGRIIGNFIVPMGTLGINVSSLGSGKSFLGGSQGESDSTM